MENEAFEITQPEASPAKRGEPRRPSSRRRTARVATPARARRSAPEREQTKRADLDQLYLSEMSGSRVLTAEQEVEIATRIVGAERSVIAALVDTPAGSHMLGGLREDLEAGRSSVRDLLLNPDQEGLDLGKVAELLIGALTRLSSGDEDEISIAVGELAGIRLDAALIDALSAAVRGGETPEDQAGAAAFDRARRELRRCKERLVVGNLRLVLMFARKYLNRGIPLLDLVQEGNLGLMRAADKFDHRRGFRFNTYAAWWIRQALQRALLDRTLRLPVHVADDRRRLGKVRAAFEVQHRREATAEELVAITGLGRDRIENILNLPHQPASLDAPIGDESDASMIDLVATKEAGPDETAALHALGADLEGLLAALTPREQQVLRMRFGMGSEREHTLEEVGRELSLTRERIRQIERAALAKLRAKSDRLDLASYL